MQQVYRAMYFIEKNKKILGQEKKLYYSGSNNWTTHYDRRKSYKTFDEANKKNESLLTLVKHIIKFHYYFIKNHLNNELCSFRPDLY